MLLILFILVLYALFYYERAHTFLSALLSSASAVGVFWRTQMRYIPLVILGILYFSSVAGAQTIAGTVFFDGNNNGVKDAFETGFPLVTVNAYSTSGLAGSGLSAGDGTYTVSGLTAGQTYRVEFIVPSGYNDGAEGGSGGNSMSSVQFVTSGATNANFGVYVPNQCISNGASLPRILAGCMPYNGDPTSLVSLDYNNTNVPVNSSITPHSGDQNANNIGVPFGFGVQKQTKLVFFSTVAAPNPSFFPAPPDGNSAIYVADYSGAGFTYQSYKLLAKLSNFGLDVSNQFPISAGVNNIGEYGLGGVAMSEDNKTLYTVNMGNGKVVRIDLANVNYASIPAGGYLPGQISVTEIAIPGAGCSNGIFRPSALEFHAGKLYVGGVCDASTSGSNAGLECKVFAMTPSNNSFTQVLSYDMTTFTTGDLAATNLPQVKWHHPFLTPPGDGNPGEMQPYLSDLAFDDAGSLILSVLNRRTFSANSNREQGYLVRTWPQSNGTFILESDRTSGPLVSTAASVSGGGVPGNRDSDAGGPGSNAGSKWFFEQGIGAFIAGPGFEYTQYAHCNLVNGGVYVPPGTKRVLAGYTDPVGIGTAGIRYMDWTNGHTFAGAILTAAKIFAITGVEGLCAAAPLEIGNLVWNDTDSDGVQDPGEAGIPGVQVKLYQGSTLISTANTDGSGRYGFSSAASGTASGWQYGVNLLTGTAYEIRIENATGGAQQVPLAGKVLTSTNTGGGDPNADVRDNDGTTSGTSVLVALTTGANGENNHTFDIGFKAYVCVNPSAISFSQTAPTCTGATPNNNGSISLTAVTNGTHYGVSTLNAASYDGPATIAGATAVPGSLPAVIQSSVPNTGGSYIIRIFNGADGCFTDQTVTVSAVTCVLPCSASVTATPGACVPATNQYTLTGTVTFSNAPASGTLTVQITGGGSQVFNAPFTSPQNYSIASQTSDGASHSVTATFSANPACTNTITYNAPANCVCSISNVTATPGVCSSSNNQYTLSGTVTFTNAPATGTLTVQITGGGSQVFNAPFVSPLNYVINGQTSDGVSHTVTATFSADPACTKSATYNAPGSCQCNVASVTANPGACNPATNKYNLTGTVTYSNPPASGTLTVTLVGVGAQTFNAPFLAPVSYSFTGLTSDGTNHAVTATFSADPACTKTSFYTAPANCTACPTGNCGTTIMIKN